MKKSELLKRIELLEARIAALEARPITYPLLVPQVPTWPPQWAPSWPWVTCDRPTSATPLPSMPYTTATVEIQ